MVRRTPWPNWPVPGSPAGHAPGFWSAGSAWDFTTAAALKRLGPGGRVVVAELVPAVVRWIRGPLAPLAGHPLQDRRVTVHEEDVVRFLESEPRAYDSVLLDVDNGPEDLIRKGNDRLYTPIGLETVRTALRPGGVLAVWSAGPDQAFFRRLQRSGFRVEEVRVRARIPREGKTAHDLAGLSPGPTADRASPSASADCQTSAKGRHLRC